MDVVGAPRIPALASGESYRPIQSYWGLRGRPQLAGDYDFRSLELPVWNRDIPEANVRRHLLQYRRGLFVPHPNQTLGPRRQGPSAARSRNKGLLQRLPASTLEDTSTKRPIDFELLCPEPK